MIEANATHWMPLALQVMVDGYFPYVPSYLPQEAEEKYSALHQLLSEDLYEPLHRSFTFVALLPDLLQSDQLTVAGTVRLIIGRHTVSQHEPSSIPALDLLSDTPTWPHRTNGQHDGMIAEWCRFAIAKQYRRSAVAITRALSLAAFHKAREFSIHFIYAVMPRKVCRIVHTASFPFQEVAGVSFLQTPQAYLFFDALPGYWQQQDPRLYYLPVGERQ